MKHKFYVKDCPDDTVPHHWIGEQVNLQHLMSHSALNMHYVNGVPLNAEENMLPIKDFLNGNKKYDYPAIEVLSKPGTVFHYLSLIHI